MDACSSEKGLAAIEQAPFTPLSEKCKAEQLCDRDKIQITIHLLFLRVRRVNLKRGRSKLQSRLTKTRFAKKRHRIPCSKQISITPHAPQ